MVLYCPKILARCVFLINLNTLAIDVILLHFPERWEIRFCYFSGHYYHIMTPLNQKFWLKDLWKFKLKSFLHDVIAIRIRLSRKQVVFKIKDPYHISHVILRSVTSRKLLKIWYNSGNFICIRQSYTWFTKYLPCVER